MIVSVSHIGLVVKDIKDILEKLAKTLGMEVPQIRDVPEKKVKFALFNLGNVDLELLEPYEDNNFLIRPSKEQPNYLHHVSLVSSDIEGDVEELRSKGVEFLREVPDYGVRNKRIIFFKPDYLDGINIELTEP